MWELLLQNFDPEISIIIGGLVTAVIYLWKRDQKRSDRFEELIVSDISTKKDLTAAIEKLTDRLDRVEDKI